MINRPGWEKRASANEHTILKTIVTRNGQSGNTGRLNRNLYVMLKFTERPKTPGITSKKHDFL